MPTKLILMRQDMQNITLIHCQTERFTKRWWRDSGVNVFTLREIIPKHRTVDVEFKDPTRCYKGHVTSGFMSSCKGMPGYGIYLNQRVELLLQPLLPSSLMLTKYVLADRGQ